MSNDTEQSTQTNELETLKARATMMGVKFHPSIGLEALREKVNAAVTSDGPVDKSDPQNTAAAATAAAAPAPAEVVEESPGQKLRRLKREQERLIRVRITCMNPHKQGIEGEIITVGNNVVGTIRKFVPFNNAEDGWHIPFIMYEVLRDRMCQIFVKDRSGPGGIQMTKSKLIREFNIEVLPDLTQDELDELARRQAMSGSVE